MTRDETIELLQRVRALVGPPGGSSNPDMLARCLQQIQCLCSATYIPAGDPEAEAREEQEERIAFHRQGFRL